VVFWREEEWGRISDLLSPVPLGPAGIGLEGVAGIGKTTLWQAAIELARERGHHVLVSAPGAPDAELPFAGLGDLLDGLPAARLDGLPAPQRRALRVALCLDEVDGSRPEPNAAARGLLGLLRELAAARPTTIAIDDEQWFDVASARVLAFALCRLRNEPVTVIVARRPQSGGALWDELAHGFGADGLQTLEIAPLDLESLRGVLDVRLPRPPTGPLLRRIHAVTAGNPLYALEIARRLAGASDADPDELPVPATLREALAQRLDRLDARAFDPLLAVAALRRATLARVGATVPGFTPRDLDDAERDGLVDVEGERVRFTHPLIASVHYSRAGAGRRRELHRRLAELVDDIEERAHHLARGTDGPDEAIAAALEEAATRAGARGAPEAAAELLERAARLTPGEHPAARRQRMLAAAARHVSAGDTARAKAVLDPLLAEPLDVATRARARVLLGRTRTDDLAEGAALFELALADAGDDDGLRAEIELLLAEAHSNLGDQAGTAEHCARAVEAARRAGERGALAKALAQGAVMAAFRGEGIRHDAMRQAIALEPYVQDVSYFYLPRTQLGCLLLWTDDARAAVPLLQGSLRRAVAEGYELDDCALRFFLAHAEWVAGDVEAARRDGAEVEIRVRQIRDGQLDAYVRWLRVFSAWREGRLAVVPELSVDAVAAAERIGDAFVSIAARAIAAAAELASGKPGAARERLQPLTAELQAGGVEILGTFVLDAWASEAEALIATGEPAAAEEAIAALERRARRSANPNGEAVAWRLRGLLAASRGHNDVALASLKRALAEHERRPVPFEVGRTLLELGTVERRGRRKAAAKARLEAALGVLEPIGAELWAARARDELGRVGLRRPVADGVTAAQARVAELVAEGLTNREIADTLYMSVRTVESHLTRVYRAYGVRSRVQLAAALGSGEPVRTP
jgi:DNA-binding CsgD family transcriptional regulator